MDSTPQLRFGEWKPTLVTWDQLLEEKRVQIAEHFASVIDSLFVSESKVGVLGAERLYCQPDYPPAIQIDPMAGFGDVPQRSRSEMDGYDPCGAHGQVFKPDTPELDAATVGDVREVL